jgi:hypothetical protein
MQVSSLTMDSSLKPGQDAKQSQINFANPTSYFTSRKFNSLTQQQLQL